MFRLSDPDHTYCVFPNKSFRQLRQGITQFSTLLSGGIFKNWTCWRMTEQYDRVSPRETLAGSHFHFHRAEEPNDLQFQKIVNITQSHISCYYFL